MDITKLKFRIEVSKFLYEMTFVMFGLVDVINTNINDYKYHFQKNIFPDIADFVLQGQM